MATYTIARHTSCCKSTNSNVLITIGLNWKFIQGVAWFQWFQLKLCLKERVALISDDWYNMVYVLQWLCMPPLTISSEIPFTSQKNY